MYETIEVSLFASLRMPALDYSHVMLTVTLGHLLILRSSPQIFETAHSVIKLEISVSIATKKFCVG